MVLDAAGRKERNRIKLAPGSTGSGGFMIARDGSRAYLGPEFWLLHRLGRMR